HCLSKKSVVVKELISIEDLGNMDVLCTDKTGTLTEGKINLVDSLNMRGHTDEYILKMALLCNTASHHHRLVGNPMDVAIWQQALDRKIGLPGGYKKIAEREFSFDHRGQFTVVEHDSERLYLFKGAADSVLDRCLTYRDATGQLVPLTNHRKKIREQLQELNRQGLRLIVVAQKDIEAQEKYGFEDAQGLELLGYLTFLDVPKHSAKHAIDTLNSLAVQVKIVTGDNELVTRKICETIGFEITGVLTGPAIARMSQYELEREVTDVNIFARVSPEQKQQIIRALKKAGKTVGYMGDGINDAAALHLADVSISVNTAVDVAKDVASIVLLRKGLDVIADGVREGRRIFANTIKYILMGTSSNFGNMFSVAGASFFLPFLPMTPSQILLNNSLYDTSQLGIPSDEVDPEVLERPNRWDIRYIYRYMLYFGPISSVFDYASFGLLWFVFGARNEAFQTGWFLESIATQVLVVFVIRTGRVFWQSRPGRLLMMMCGAVLAIAFLLPWTPIAVYLHLVALPPMFFLALLSLVAAYLLIVEFVKRRFLSRI
ncbi:HAD-IC family P-type ATPase, partial [Patescibacteria group bacterium]|nr:HAD-IC family P-type ATPase [Patescibacteria group bacterium]